MKKLVLLTFGLLLVAEIGYALTIPSQAQHLPGTQTPQEQAHFASLGIAAVYGVEQLRITTAPDSSLAWHYDRNGCLIWDLSFNGMFGLTLVGHRYENDALSQSMTFQVDDDDIASLSEVMFSPHSVTKSPRFATFYGFQSENVTTTQYQWISDPTLKEKRQWLTVTDSIRTETRWTEKDSSQMTHFLDSKGRVVRVEGGNNNVTHYSYNTFGSLTQARIVSDGNEVYRKEVTYSEAGVPTRSREFWQGEARSDFVLSVIYFVENEPEKVFDWRSYEEMLVPESERTRVLGKKVKEEESEVFVVVEKQPQLIGGLKAVYQNLVYPEMARRAGIQGRVIVSFIVETDVSVTEPKIIRGIGGGCDEAAIEAIKKAKFTPAMQRGRLVRVQYSLPITFALAEEPKKKRKRGRG